MRSGFGMGFETTARAKWTLPVDVFSIRISARALPLFRPSFAPFFPLPPFVILHLFSFFQRGLKKRSGGRETRELAFRGTYGYLFSRRRKYPALFFSLHPLYSSSIPLLSHSLGIRMVCRFDLAKKRAPFRSRNKIHRSLFASFQKTARLTKVSAMEISKFSPYTCWSIKLICQSKSDCFCNFY